MTKKWVNVTAMISLQARVVYRPSLKLYLSVSEDPLTAVIIGYSNFICFMWGWATRLRSASWAPGHQLLVRVVEIRMCGCGQYVGMFHLK